VTWLHGALADHIRKDGREIGYSSGTIYSCYFREVLSMGVIDLDPTADASTQAASQRCASPSCRSCFLRR
jgi:hypothetical protein